MMFNRIISVALLPWLLAACVQDGSAMVENENPAGPNNAAANAPSAEALQFSDTFITCNSDAVQGWIGRKYSPDSEPALLKASGTSSLRTARPGQPISMDYQTERLTIELDEADVIVALRCG